MTRIFIIFIFFLSLRGFSQEALRPLTANINYLYTDLSVKKQGVPVGNSAQKTQSVSLYLPFRDDFSYADTSSYPDPGKWNDSLVYINSGYPIAPPSIGVATFDGLNKYGYPYQPSFPNLAISRPADTLTSKPINLFTTASSQTLQAGDSIALTFFYQARGYGDSPELSDTLIVDFFKPKQNKWANVVWYKLGNSGPNINDTVFKYASIRIADTAYLHDNFRFRFRGKASPTGTFDNWHVDYIVLDKNISLAAVPVYKDLSFVYVPTPYLRDYSAMPLKQYIVSEMATKNLVKIRNNYNQTLNSTYEARFFDPAGTEVKFYAGGSFNLPPFNPNGYSPYVNHANPTFNYSFPESPLDSMDYRIEHKVFESNTADFFSENDKVVQYQRFRNYYALDDGSAEAGYYVNTSGAKMATKIKVNVQDSLIAVRLYIDPVGYVSPSTPSKGFRINVWSPSQTGPGPGNLLYRDTTFYPRYYSNKANNTYSEYRLAFPRQLGPGEYYIGIQQFAIESPADIITIGFDRNTDHRQSLYFDSGSGWEQSVIPGSIMIRPVLGKTLPPPVGISEIAKNTISIRIYPNPASNEVILIPENELVADYSINNALGQVVASGAIENREQHITTENLDNGIYFITVKTNTQLVQQTKLIIQH